MSTNEGTSLRKFQPLLLTIRLSRQTRSGKFAALYYIRVGNGNGLEPGPWIARRVRRLKTVPGHRLLVAHGDMLAAPKIQSQLVPLDFHPTRGPTRVKKWSLVRATVD